MRRKTLRYWLLLSFLVSLVYIVADTLTSGFSANSYGNRLLQWYNDHAFFVDGLLCLLLFFIVFPYQKKLAQRYPWPSPEPFRGRWLLIGGILCLAETAVDKFWFMLVDKLSFVEFLQTSMAKLEMMWTPTPEAYIWIVLNLVVIGSMLEEYLFRGIILRFLSAYYGPGRAIGISALIFGLWHGNLVQMIYTFIFGLLVGYVYVRTGRLGWPILLHGLSNLISILPLAFSSLRFSDGLELLCYLALPLGILLLIPILREWFHGSWPKPQKIRQGQ